MRLWPADIGNDPAWTGRIERLEIRLTTPGGKPLRLQRIGIPRGTVAERCELFSRQWFAARLVDARSINALLAPHVMGRTPAMLLALGSAAVLAAWVGVATWRGRRVRRGMLLAVSLVAYLAFDIRILHVNLTQLQMDRRKYANQAPIVRRSNAWPPQIAQMATLVEQAVPEGCVYAVVGGNLRASAGDSMLRYLLAPRWVQINVDELQPRVAPERAEYVLILERDAASIDPATGTLQAPGLPRMRVERVVDVANGPVIVRRVEP